MSMKQRGFTLIEISLVLAISGILLVLAITAQAGIRQQSQFTDSIETTATNINNLKNQVNTTLQTDSGASGTTLGETYFAKVLSFSVGSTTYVATDYYYTPNAVAGTNITQVGQSQIYTIPWNTSVSGLLVNGTPQSSAVMVFQLNQTSGDLIAYPLQTLPSLVATNFGYLPGTFAITLTGANGKKATITVDGTSGGTVTRAFQ